MKKLIVSAMMAAAFIFATNAQSVKVTKDAAKATVTQTKKDVKATKEAVKTRCKSCKRGKENRNKKGYRSF